MTLPRQQTTRFLLFLHARLLSAVLALLTASRAAADVDWNVLPLTPINQMQAVKADGSSAWSIPLTGGQPGYKFRGVVLNDPAQMLDPTPAEGYDPGGSLGGQWQIFAQAALGGDFGGMCLWMGQNYGNLSWILDPDRSYSDAAWTAELHRLNYPIDVATGLPVNSPLRPGDLIEVRARAGMPYKGKFNCNEKHWNDKAFDFDIYVVMRDLPLNVQDLALESLKYANDAFIFDQTRLTGGEFYQGQMVRLRNVTITNPENWAAYGTLNVTDGTRNFAIKLGDNASFTGTSAPAGLLDVVGVFDQESSDTVIQTDGYRMWALTPDAFTLVPEPTTLFLLIGCGLLFRVLRKR
jgi:hypothetical protein